MSVIEGSNFFAFLSFCVAIFGAVWLYHQSKNAPSVDAEIFKFGIVFYGLLCGFYLLSEPFFSSGGYGLFDAPFSNLAGIEQLALVAVMALCFLVALFCLVMLPVLLFNMDDDYALSKRKAV